MGGACILVIDDSLELAELICKSLKDETYEATCVFTGEAALRQLGEHWNLVILDLMLPDMDGAEILDFISSKPDPCPVLVLTAKGSVSDKVDLFRRGCDDYLVKPFEVDELIVRVQALLKRPPKTLANCFYEDLHLLEESSELLAGEKKVLLTPKEFALFRYLIKRPGEIVSRQKILHSVWGLSREPITNYMDVHLTNLRKKLASVGRESWLRTFRGMGITLRSPALGEQ